MRINNPTTVCRIEKGWYRKVESGVDIIGMKQEGVMGWEGMRCVQYKSVVCELGISE